jgi:sterol desaturase/sphingolipid hydroxylase (fatty acid hydroxylase superfamily)
VHHSPTHLNLSAAYRLGWTAQFTGGLLFFLPLPLLGFAPPTIGLILAANLIYQFWLHTELIPKLGWFEWLFNTPSHHRVHHASNAAYLDANFGGVLIVFDRLFGTLVDENEAVPCRYGLVDPVASNNPLYIVAHEWIAMTRDVVHATRLADRIGYVFGRPGWRAREARQSHATAVAMTASADAATSTC